MQQRVSRHQITDEGFGDRGVYPVHRHVIAVEGRPPQAKLGEVAGSNHDTAKIAGVIHEDLGPLTSLGVFIGKIPIFFAVVNIFEVLEERILDVDLLKGDAHGLREILGIVVGPFAGAESRHSDGMDAFEIMTEFSKSLIADEQGQGAVETTGETHQNHFAVNGGKTFCEPGGLHGKNQANPFQVDALFFGNERILGIVSLKNKGFG